MKTLYTLILVAIAILSTACHHIDDYPNDNVGSFEALWNEIDRHYCFFSEKEVDWDDVYSRYAPLVSNNMNRSDFFILMAKMIDELRDGHTNLSAPFATSYYRAWWSDYPQNYDGRLIEQYYFNFNYRQIGSFTYEILPQNIGYLRVPTFQSGLGAGNIDYIINYFSKCTGLIIDVRDNGGGNLTNVEDLVNRFITQRTLAGYIIHKTGPGHNDFDQPYAYYFNPAGPEHLGWSKPVVVLTNRSTFSAANNFVSIMKLLPQVTIIGDTTGGGSGMPYSSELPNGWSIRFSACSILDAEGNITEFGVEPTEGFDIDMDPQAILDGHDTILDAAIKLLS